MPQNGTRIQLEYYRQGDEAARMLPIAVEEWEQAARERLAAGPFGYVAGGAGAGDTMRANLQAFQRWSLLPRVCHDISKRELGVELFGRRHPLPFLLAPIGVLSILHPQAELPAARAMGDAERWFQLYPPKDRELTTSFLQRAEAAGYAAIVVTLDSTLLGWREQDLRNAYLPFLSGQGMGSYFTDPVFRAKLGHPPEEKLEAAVQRALDEGNNTCLTWEQIRFIREQTKLPLLLKGITHPEDAALALEHGVDGIIVSNHGGRQLDGAVATLDALPAVCATVRGRVPVLLDSGIRRGADVIKALALGASAVLLGRPYAYALAVAGEKGVKAVIDHLAAQVELQMAIAGRSSIRQLDRSVLSRPAPAGGRSRASHQAWAGVVALPEARPGWLRFRRPGRGCGTCSGLALPVQTGVVTPPQTNL
ncbi:MAG: alpha-hydroxy-acid oxidizing protein [Bacillota bacterium]